MSPHDRIASALRNSVFRCSNEAELQEGIVSLLDTLVESYDREHKIGGSRDRVDFMCGGTGIEVKVGGSITALTRQIHRYLQHDEVQSVIVVTTRTKHKNIPKTVSGKTVDVICVGMPF